MKRFYKNAAPSVDGDVLLDGKPVRTPGGLTLRASTPELAAAVAEEWQAQGDAILPASMPLTQILTTQIERVSAQRDEMTHLLLNYLNTDLLCYRTTHDGIALRQNAVWDPWLLWFGRRFDAMLAVTDRLQALTQPEEAQQAVRAALDAMDDARFTVAQLVTALTGSVVLGLAFAEGELSPADAFTAANIDEIYKGELYNEALYGKAPNQEKADAAMRTDLDAAARYLVLTRRD